MNHKTSLNSNNENKQLSIDIGTIQVESVSTFPSAKKGTATSLRSHYKDFGPLTFADYEIFSKLPEHPFWSQVEQLIDFSFANCTPHPHTPHPHTPHPHTPHPHTPHPHTPHPHTPHPHNLKKP